jgi:hypothetical protein
VEQRPRTCLGQSSVFLQKFTERLIDFCSWRNLWQCPQVMADSADACAKSIMHHCHSARLVPKLCSALCKDRSAKLRQCCADYLTQVRACTIAWYAEASLYCK